MQVLVHRESEEYNHEEDQTECDDVKCAAETTEGSDSSPSPPETEERQHSDVVVVSSPSAEVLALDLSS